MIHRRVRRRLVAIDVADQNQHGVFYFVCTTVSHSVSDIRKRASRLTRGIEVSILGTGVKTIRGMFERNAGESQSAVNSLTQ